MRDLLIFFVLSIPQSLCLPEPVISDLEADPNFRTVTLNWRYPKEAPQVRGFVITYCEDQAWGKSRCKDKIFNSSEIAEYDDEGYLFRYFRASVGDLRIATNYTIDVRPLPPERSNFSSSATPKGRALNGHIFIQTKGFYARAINCLSNTSVVEIETGPNFGGMISVEGSTDERCILRGNANSSQTNYRLVIDHNFCGSKQQNSSVKSFIIVQENLPILTHSTRRFMIVCSYVPETFTVRAGVNIPDSEDISPNALPPVGKDVFEVDPSEFFDSSGNLLNSREGRRIGGALRMSARRKEEEPQRWGHVVLMVVLVMVAIFGISCAVMHFIKTSKQRRRERSPSLPGSDSSHQSTGDLDEYDVHQHPSIVTIESGDYISLNDHLYQIVSPELPDSILLNQPADVDNMPLTYHSLEFPFYGQFDSISHDESSKFPLDLIPAYNRHEGLMIPQDMPSFSSFIPVNPGLSVPVENLENIDAIFDDQGYHASGSVIEPTEMYTPHMSSSDEEYSQIPCSENVHVTIPQNFQTVFYDDSLHGQGVTQSEGSWGDCAAEHSFENHVNHFDSQEDPTVGSEEVSSANGSGINWHLRDKNGIMFPAVSL